MKKSSLPIRRPYTTHPSKTFCSSRMKKPQTSTQDRNNRMRNSYNKENNQSNYESQRLTINKKLRNAEADRKAYAEETVAIIKKQRTKLEFLQQENSVLKENLTQGLDKKFLSLNRQVPQPVTATLEDNSEETNERYSRCIVEEEKKLRKIQNNIKIFEKQIGIKIFELY